MKTLLRNKDYILLDGEVYFLTINGTKANEYLYDEKLKCIYTALVDSDTLVKHVYRVTHSTASLQGVKQLDRSLFVKGVDVEELYEQAKTNIGYNSYDSQDEYFHSGYNANKNDWTDQEFKFAIHKAVQLGKQGLGATESVKIIKRVLRPLSLPSSIIIEGEEIKQINW